jgi:threonine/homoserine/homoserine lactone efflux protein
MLLRNIILGLSLAAPIGPVNIEIIKSGLMTGFSPAFFIGLGAMTADALYLTLTYFGLSHLFMFPIAKLAIGIIGAAILFYLGAMSIWEAFRKFELKASNKSRKHAYLMGFSIAVSSPMTIVWWVGVFGSVLATASRPLTLLSCYSIILGAGLWVFSLSAVLQFGKKYVNEKSLRVISVLAGLMLMYFAAFMLYYLAVSGRSY